MRLGPVCLVGLTGCAQIFGLAQPVTDDAVIGSDSHPQDGPPTVCRGDNFDDNALDMSLWVPFTEAQTQLDERNNRLEVTLDNSNGSAYAGVDTRTVLATGEVGVQVEVVQATANNASETSIALFVNSANQLILTKDGLLLRAIVRTAGSNDPHEIPYVESMHRFFRIELTASNGVEFTTSSDGVTWTLMRDTSASFASQSMKAQVYAGHYQQVPPATAAFDNFVILNASCL